MMTRGRYEDLVLMLKQLTPHQERKRAECRGRQHVHIRAPAGAGKTFVAMYEMHAPPEPWDPDLSHGTPT